MSRLQVNLNRLDSDPEELKRDFSGEVTMVNADQFEGDVNILSALISVTVTTIPIIGMLIKEHIRAKKYIKVRYKGIEVQGENLEKIEEFLQRVLRHDNAK